MFTEMTYCDLEEWRDELMLETAGTQDEENLKWIKVISQEITRREEIARRRILRAAAAINIIVLLTILFTTGCQTVKGVTGDAGWILTEMSNNIQTQEK